MALTQEELDAILKKRENTTMKTIAGINGLTGIVGNTNALTQIGDTYSLENQISDLSQIGRGLVSFGDISQDYSRLGSQPQINYDDIRGMSKQEQFGNVLSSTLTGATTGATVGGPWGAVAGAAIGLGSGLTGLVLGKQNAQSKMESLQLNSLISNNDAINNLNASSEYTTDLLHRQRVANINSSGGQLKRKYMTATEFADKVMSRQKGRPVTGSSGIVIKKCDGGTMIRIKR